jgi:hypothetical protein
VLRRLVEVTTDLSRSKKSIEGQYNIDVRDGLLQEIIRGEKWRLRIHWENYF